MNGYPLKIFELRYAKMLKKFEQNPPPSSTEKPPRIILPFIGQTTNKITAFLRRQLKCEFGYIPGQKLGQMLCNQKSNATTEKVGIYTINCSCKRSYVGETNRKVEIRVAEHRNDVKKKKETSALATHIKSYPTHQIDFDSASLIHREPRYFHRKFLEGLYIQKAFDPLNRDGGMKINPIWSSVMLPLIKNPQ
jgi:predicted GIY-YIG superfamily endonuclease